MADVFGRTRQTYASAGGAAAYMKKEAANEMTRNRHIWRLLDGIELEGRHILDVGCGFGGDVAEMRRRGGEAYGVDASPELLAEAVRRFGHADWWLERDVLALEESPVGMVDLIWSVAFLVHVPRDTMPGLLRRWISWLKPGGQLMLVTKEGEGERVMDNLGDAYPRVMVYYRPEELLRVFEEAGVLVEMAEHSAQGVMLPTGDMLMQFRIRKR